MIHTVISLGTEYRRPSAPVVAQPGIVYDYIQFRGSDIKDIRLLDKQQTVSDPAIIQMTLATSQMPGPVVEPPGEPPGQPLPLQTLFSMFADQINNRQGT